MREARKVGMVFKGAEGHVLFTPGSSLRLISEKADLDGWEGERVLIAGERTEEDAVLVSQIYSMMSERELRECTSFILSRHGQRAREHAFARIDSAIARNHPRDVEIWKSIGRRIDLALARELWPRK